MSDKPKSDQTHQRTSISIERHDKGNIGHSSRTTLNKEPRGGFNKEHRQTETNSTGPRKKE